MLFGMSFDFRNAVEHGALEIEFHHHAQCLREAGIHADGEIQSGDAAIFNQPAKRWEGLADLVARILLGVVALLLRAEDSLHFGVVIEEREEDGNALNDGGAEFRLDAFPIVSEPALDGFQLSQLLGTGLVPGVNCASLQWNAPHPQYLPQLGGSRRQIAVFPLVVNETKPREVGSALAENCGRDG